jgi:hypothetical protein
LQAEPKINTYKKDLFLSLVFILFLVIILITRVMIFFDLNTRFIDSDQPLMWIGARDFSKGLFYEPRYYGQSYNTLLESLFAVPLLWLKIPVYYALPVATHFLSLFPFLFTASYLFFHEKKEQALLVLAVILCMPAAYDISNSISRGFVTGLFFTSFFVVSLVHPRRLSLVFLNTLMALTGYYVNPNSVLVSGPFLFYLFLIHHKNRRYYLLNFIGLPAAWLLHLFFDQLYIKHPDYVVLGLHLRFSPEYFWNNISNLDERFGQLSFFIENKCWPLLLALFLSLFFLYRQNKKAAACFVVFIALVLFSFSAGKTLEGSSWPFYSYNRMYLGIPLMMCLFFSFLTLKTTSVTKFLFFIPILFSVYKLSFLKESIDYYTDDKQFRHLQVLPLKGTLEALDFYKNICKKNDVKMLLVSTGFWLHAAVSYGGPAIHEDFPATQETDTDRRYWIREGNRNKVFEKFIFVSPLPGFDKKVAYHKDFTLQKLDDYGLYLVSHNTLTNSSFIDMVKAVEFQK